MNDNYYVGIDIGGTSTKIGIINNNGKLIEKTQVKMLKNQNWEKLVNEFLVAIKKWIDEKYNIKAIGIGIPGFFNNNTGLVQNCENVPNLIGVPFIKYISNNLKIPVFADNDATAAAIGENIFGAGVDFKDYILVTIGTGIGGGLILNNEIYRGINGYAGEIGHMIVVAEGRECSCGNRGCVEPYSSATAIIKSIKYGIKKGFITSYTPDEIDNLSAQIIFKKAHEGDPHSFQAVDSAARYLGRMLGSIINLLNLEAIIIGGGVAASGNYFIEKIKFYCEQVAWNLFTKELKIIPAKLLNDAGIIGAASLAIQEYNKSSLKNNC